MLQYLNVITPIWVTSLWFFSVNSAVLILQLTWNIWINGIKLSVFSGKRCRIVFPNPNKNLPIFCPIILLITHRSSYYSCAFQKSSYQHYSHINKNTCAGPDKRPVCFNCSPTIAPKCCLWKSVRKTSTCKMMSQQFTLRGFLSQVWCFIHSS